MSKKHWTQTPTGKLRLKQIIQDRKNKETLYQQLPKNTVAYTPRQPSPEEVAFKRGYESALENQRNSLRNARISFVESVSKLNSAAAGILEFLGER